MLTAPAPAAARDPFMHELRAREFARLDRDGLAYLDYTGSALYAERQLREHHALLASSVFANPHSENAPSRASSEIIAAARAAVLRLFDASSRDYVVAFTANTSAAVKLVGESFPFSSGSLLALSTDNHNSVIGMREFARRAGATVAYLPLDDDLRLDDPAPRLAELRARHGGDSLFAFPAQSNFSGVKHPLELVTLAQRLGFRVLLDAAAFAPSNPLSLARHPADFVTVSFYKIFGYPTGVGALVARRDALAALRRPWFAGGTIDFASVQNDMFRLRDTVEAFEDGTPDFLSIAALSSGFALYADVGIDRITRHVGAHTAVALQGLTSLTHRDGSPLVRLYGPSTMDARGATLTFNVLQRDGRIVPYTAVEARANDARVAVRCGCFCNPGASERAFGFDPVRAGECMTALRDAGFTIDRFAECLGGDTAVGAVRVSMGLANNARDVERAIELVASFAA